MKHSSRAPTQAPLRVRAGAPDPAALCVDDSIPPTAPAPARLFSLKAPPHSEPRRGGAMATEPALGAFMAEGSSSSEAARDMWASHLGFTQGRPDLSGGIGGERLPTAPALPKLGGPEDPGRMIKDWQFYKYRPHSTMTCSLNRYGPDFRWPGLNNTPQIRHHLALVKRATPKLILPPTVWTDLPRIEPGPGQDYIIKRFEKDKRAQAKLAGGFRNHRQNQKLQLATKQAHREELERRTFALPG